MANSINDTLTFDEHANIAQVFAERVKRSPDRVAYRDFESKQGDWNNITWAQAAESLALVRAALSQEGFAPGDRVAIMLRNCSQWAIFDQAAFANGLVTVPLFADDRPDNIAYILNDSECKAILVDGDEHLKKLRTVTDQLEGLQRIVTLRSPNASTGETTTMNLTALDSRVRSWADWTNIAPSIAPLASTKGTELATIVYTSGTTGKPKGVMLSHRNILSNVQSSLGAYDIYSDDVFLSFLPLSHMFERTVGYMLTIVTGSTVAYARSLLQLGEDFKRVRPSIIVAVPRIFERLNSVVQDQLKKAPQSKRKMFDFAWNVGWNRFEWKQGRGGWQLSFLLWPILKKLVANKLLERFGGNLRLCISGGAALNPQIAHTFLGLGLPICQGYGLTEASPVVSVNLLHRNNPSSIGPALRGIEVALGDNSALLVKGDCVMMGYWKRQSDTDAVISSSGWLNTGDQARIDDGVITITGRIKDIIVLGNGEKVPPVDMELAVQLDPLMEQVLIVGEGRPFLSALVVLNMDEWFKIAQENGLVANPNGENKDRAEKLVAGRIAKLTKGFPGYAQVRKVTLIAEEKWTLDNGLLTPTLKLKRGPIMEKYKTKIEDMYKGHTM